MFHVEQNLKHMANVTLGGERLGSGKKQKIYLRHYERSTHNLSYNFQSSLAPGVLYPYLCLPATNGDTFEIDTDALVRTIPTHGPLFSTFKLQLDVFQCPIRLYQGILHNNPINIGLKMKEVLLPTITINDNLEPDSTIQGITEDTSQISTSSLIKYLGISGLGYSTQKKKEIKRSFNAVPILAYYDIFKNYYANKQEEKAYIITPNEEYLENDKNNFYGLIFLRKTPVLNPAGQEIPTPLYYEKEATNHNLELQGTNPTERSILQYIDHYYVIIDLSNQANSKHPQVDFSIEEDFQSSKLLVKQGKMKVLNDDQKREIYLDIQKGKYELTLEQEINLLNYLGEIPDYKVIILPDMFTGGGFMQVKRENVYIYSNSSIQLQEFDLENIDHLREKLLTESKLGTAIDFNENNTQEYPMKAITKRIRGNNANKFIHNGLVVKTYQSDIFNTFLNTEYIDGENGIGEITKIDTKDGLKLDTLNLAQKVYNMLNRIAVSGGTYQDWQRAVWDFDIQHTAETPIYCGGMSSEVVFEEVVNTAQSEKAELGHIGGRGTIRGKKGGKIHIKVEEPSFIIGIVSLTPRITYTQGNQFYMTDLFSVDDFHKPELDGIGFQDLLGERMHWKDTGISEDGKIYRRGYAKTPAWLEYMTNYDKSYGDFANQADKNFMTLSRNYEITEVTPKSKKYKIKDFTSYIDPVKFNYAFAYNDLAAQNFWIQIANDIIARRLISAKQIPNL